MIGQVDQRDDRHVIDYYYIDTCIILYYTFVVMQRQLWRQRRPPHALSMNEQPPPLRAGLTEQPRIITVL